MEWAKGKVWAVTPYDEKNKDLEPNEVPEDSREQVQAGPGKPRKYYDPIIFRDWCKACGICIAFCPKHVIGRSKDGKPVIERPDDCIGCRFCELHCPDFAITVKERPSTSGRHFA
ncbi:MAG: 4Fe-4S dicluster domain-containing protein [Thermodesulfobacteriota bacterium]